MTDTDKQRIVDEHGIPAINESWIQNTDPATKISQEFGEMAKDVVGVLDRLNSVLQGRLDDDPQSPSRNTMPSQPLNVLLMQDLLKNAIKLTQEEVEMLDIELRTALPIGFRDIVLLETPEGKSIAMYINRDEKGLITSYQAIVTA